MLERSVEAGFYPASAFVSYPEPRSPSFATQTFGTSSGEPRSGSVRRSRRFAPQMALSSSACRTSDRRSSYNPRVPVGTPFHARTFPLCESLNYRDWSGYYTVSAYEAHHEHEYNAIRNARGADRRLAAVQVHRLPGRMRARWSIASSRATSSRMAVGQVFYTPWCDEHGHVIDDGTVSRLEEQRFRWTAAEPNLRWFTQNAQGLDVTIDDVSESLAALALQGPLSAQVLRRCSDIDIDRLKYFRVASGRIGGVAVDVSRTGYTGDLGYEIWIPAEKALDGLGCASSMPDGRSTSCRPACWRSTSRASRPDCCSSTWISSAARRR